MQHVLVLAGEIGAGKSAITDYLSGWYGAGKHKFSSPLRKILDVLGKDLSRENIGTISQAIRHGFGEDVIGDALAREIQSDPARLVVVDGARRPSDLGPISHLPGYRLVYIDASLRTRYDRVTKRRENAGEHHKTFEEFAATQDTETEAHIHGLKEISHDVIVNETDLAQLHAQLDALMEKIGVKK